MVHADYSSWLRSLVLYVGAGAARRNQPVLSDDGLVGRVIRVAGAYAKVQLLTDRAASAGVQLQRSRRQGVVRGSSPGELLLDFIPRQADVEVGETVLTAGIDGVYPRGIRVGVVASVEPGSEVLHIPDFDMSASSRRRRMSGAASLHCCTSPAPGCCPTSRSRSISSCSWWRSRRGTAAR